jgi:hypothetical protein
MSYLAFDLHWHAQGVISQAEINVPGMRPFASSAIKVSGPQLREHPS